VNTLCSPSHVLSSHQLVPLEQILRKRTSHDLSHFQMHVSLRSPVKTTGLKDFAVPYNQNSQGVNNSPVGSHNRRESGCSGTLDTSCGCSPRPRSPKVSGICPMAVPARQSRGAGASAQAGPRHQESSASAPVSHHPWLSQTLLVETPWKAVEPHSFHLVWKV
jgi:hypothetical protein